LDKKRTAVLFVWGTLFALYTIAPTRTICSLYTCTWGERNQNSVNLSAPIYTKVHIVNFSLTCPINSAIMLIKHSVFIANYTIIII